MKFQGKTPLQEAFVFVIVDCALHDQLKKDIMSGALLNTLKNQRPSPVPPVLFGKQYIKLHKNKMESFLVWLKYAEKKLDKLYLHA